MRGLILILFLASCDLGTPQQQPSENVPTSPCTDSIILTEELLSDSMTVDSTVVDTFSHEYLILNVNQDGVVVDTSGVFTELSL